MVLLCCAATAVLPRDSPAVSGGGGVAVGRGVAAPGSGTTEGVCVGVCVVMGCVEEGEKNTTCIPSHFTCISHSENGVQTTISGGTSNVCRGYTHTCSTHAILLTDSPLTGVC